MIFRFCLYGFLKNQRYFEPFIILAFLEKGLTFWDIGLLVGFREVCTLLLEIPSGAVADVFGRRRSMVLSFLSYIISFLIFATAAQLIFLLPAMFFFALGDAFRTGTHKAMIFEWLRLENRLDERVKVYGLTRSWSKTGSALSSLMAATLVIISGSYTTIFWLAVIPYVLNLINFMGYPESLDGQKKPDANIAAAVNLTGRVLKQSGKEAGLRGLILESMLLEGSFKATKDYLQPILQALALGLPLLVVSELFPANFTPDQRSALLIGLVFFGYFLTMGVASRHAHRWSDALGGEEALTGLMWGLNLVVFAGMGWALWLNQPVGAVVAFILLGMIQNTFRPAQISRFDKNSTPEMGATLLSVESQSKSLAAAVIAPLLGWAVDTKLSQEVAANPDLIGDVRSFWPVAAFGVVASLGGLIQRSNRSRTFSSKVIRSKGLSSKSDGSDRSTGERNASES